MQSTLDKFLEIAREDAPADNGFVLRVMSAVREEPQRAWWRQHRFFTRPAAIVGTVAVLATGSAVAALVGSNVLESDRATPAPQTQATTRVTARPQAPVADVAVPSAAAVSEPAADRVVSHRKGDLEWGYVSGHTAYALDRKTGLRLETESYTNDFVVGTPQRVTLTLANTGDKAIALSSPRGCALSVAAFRPKDADKFNDPKTAHDAASKGSWTCATSRTNQSGSDERFVLAPGAKRTANAMIELTDAGEWGVVGTCQCSYEEMKASDPLDPTRADPINALRKSSLPAPILPEEPADGSRLFTPPIRVKATG